MTHPRSHFTPCLYRSLLYLASATKDLRAVEVFNPETEAFGVLPVALPAQLRLENASVAFIVNEELCLLTEARQWPGGRLMLSASSGFQALRRAFRTSGSLW